LTRMCRIVATDAVDTTNRKNIAGANDSKRRLLHFKNGFLLACGVGRHRTAGNGTCRHQAGRLKDAASVHVCHVVSWLRMVYWYLHGGFTIRPCVAIYTPSALPGN